MTLRNGLLRAVLVLLLGLVAVVFGRAIAAGRPRPSSEIAGVTEAVDAPRVAETLAAAVRCRTVSREAGAVDAPAFAELRAVLAARLPHLHAALRREVVNGSSLLFEWPGSEPALAPILLLAHQDVVPVEEGTDAGWHAPPFAGQIADGFVWGRGALDDKAALVSLLTAAEQLLDSGFAPRRTVLLAFGHDEEIGGEGGAKQLAAHLAARGVHPELVLDEGMALTEGIVAGVARPVALIGVAEKGFASIELTVTEEGGHSSMPPRTTAIGRLARAVAKVESRSMPARVCSATRGLFRALAPEMGFGRRLLLANLWLFQPLVEWGAARDPSMDAMFRTTTAPTIFQAGTKENVLASRARAVVNFRILPGDRVETVLEHVRRAVDDPRVEVRVAGVAQEPSPASPASGWGFAQVERAVREVWPRAVVAPTLVLGGTDARHYAALAGSALRFAPLHLRPGDLERVHGRDERIAVADLADAVRFYLRLLRGAAG